MRFLRLNKTEARPGIRHGQAVMKADETGIVIYDDDGSEIPLGTSGKSAYQIARDHGYGGTESQWLASLKGGPGDKGPDGDPGPQGEAGPQGDAGPPGEKGPDGDKGPTGDAGATGSPGPAGPQGEAGPQGQPGADGAAGAAGPAGPSGPSGDPGPSGDAGAQGAVGDKGPTGDKGATGDKGPVGDKGPTGDTGAAGADGVPTAAWPVGSVFISAVSTNPSTLLGFGTWAAFGAGRVLVGRDSGDADFDTAEETGGAKTKPISAHAGATVADHAALSHSAHAGSAVAAHTDVPTHTHPHNMQGGTTGTTSGTNVMGSAATGGSARAMAIATGAPAGAVASQPHSVTQPNAHSDHAAQAHTVGQASNHTDLNVVQPYIVVYMWKRTA